MEGQHYTKKLPQKNKQQNIRQCPDDRSIKRLFLGV